MLKRAYEEVINMLIYWNKVIKPFNDVLGIGSKLILWFGLCKFYVKNKNMIIWVYY